MSCYDNTATSSHAEDDPQTTMGRLKVWMGSYKELAELEALKVKNRGAIHFYNTYGKEIMKWAGGKKKYFLNKTELAEIKYQNGTRHGSRTGKSFGSI